MRMVIFSANDIELFVSKSFITMCEINSTGVPKLTISSSLFLIDYSHVK